MKIETRIYDDKTIIPSYYLKKYHLEEEDFVVWDENDDDKIVISFRKR